MKVGNVLLALLVSGAVGAAYAADIQSDNGGNGFSSWTVNLTSGDAGQNGSFTGDSTGNGNGADDGTVGGTASDGDIGNPAWGLYANSGQTASMVYSLSGGSLSVGQTISIDFDNGFLDTGATVGISLWNSSDENVWEMFFVGGNSFYQVNDSSGVNDTTLGFTDEGLNVAFTLTGAATYSAVINTLGGASDTVSGTLLNPAGGQTVDQVRVFNFNAGSGGSNNLYANNLSVVPEPSTMVLAGIGVLGLIAARFRRR